MNILNLYKNNKNFPYFALYSEKTPEELFSRLQEFTPKVKILYKPFKLFGFKPPKSGLFSRISFGKKNQFILIKSADINHEDLEGLTDFFNEIPRMRARKNYKSQPPIEIWKQKHSGFNTDSYTKSQIKQFRDDFFQESGEATLMRLSWIKGIYCILEKIITTSTSFAFAKEAKQGGISMLDFSAGWGDRLLVAISMDWDYTGFDPNTDLKAGHSAIIKQFGDSRRHKVIYSGFETVELSQNYDFIFTSPPFFDLEEYSPESSQSIKQYPNFTDWKNKFLFASIFKCWKHLKFGGVFAIYISDYQEKKVILEMLNLIKTFQNAFYVGIIGLEGGRGKNWPVFCWKKLNKK